MTYVYASICVLVNECRTVVLWFCRTTLYVSVACVALDVGRCQCVCPFVHPSDTFIYV